MRDLIESRDTVNACMERFGVRFGVYKNGVFNEQLFPFDSIPRVISKDDWEVLERGLIQRVNALNSFLHDVYHKKHIIADGVILTPGRYNSAFFERSCQGCQARVSLSKPAATVEKLPLTAEHVAGFRSHKKC